MHRDRLTRNRLTRGSDPLNGIVGGFAALLGVLALSLPAGFVTAQEFAHRHAIAADDDFDEVDDSKVAVLGKIVVPKGAQEPEPPVSGAPRTVVVKAGRNDYRVECNRKTKFIVHETLAIKDAPSESGAWVLAAYQAATRAEDYRRFPPQMIKINAIVLVESADDFRPPAVSSEMRKLRVRWMYGKLKSDSTEFSFSSKDFTEPGDANMQTGRERQVLRIAKGKIEDLAVDQIVFVNGHSSPVQEESEAKADAPDIVATSIIRLSPEFSAKDYAPILEPQVAPKKRPKKR